MIMKRDKSEKMNIMQRKKVWMVTCLGWARKGQNYARVREKVVNGKGSQRLMNKEWSVLCTKEREKKVMKNH